MSGGAVPGEAVAAAAVRPLPGAGVPGGAPAVSSLENGPDGTRPFMAATCHSNIPVTRTSTIASPRRWPEEKRSGLLSRSGG